MQNAQLWRDLGRNSLISILLFGALLGLLWLVELIFPSLNLLKWQDTAWVVGIPASVIGVAYILTIRDPKNFTGFYAGIIMSILLGVQFLLQKQFDSAFLYFLIFILNDLLCKSSHLSRERKQDKTYDEVKAQMDICDISSVNYICEERYSNRVIDRIDNDRKENCSDYVEQQIAESNSLCLLVGTHAA